MFQAERSSSPLHEYALRFLAILTLRVAAFAQFSPHFSHCISQWCGGPSTDAKYRWEGGDLRPPSPFPRPPRQNDVGSTTMPDYSGGARRGQGCQAGLVCVFSNAPHRTFTGTEGTLGVWGRLRGGTQSNVSLRSLVVPLIPPRLHTPRRASHHRILHN